MFIVIRTTPDGIVVVDAERLKRGPLTVGVKVSISDIEVSDLTLMHVHRLQHPSLQLVDLSVKPSGRVSHPRDGGTKVGR